MKIKENKKIIFTFNLNNKKQAFYYDILKRRGKNYIFSLIERDLQSFLFSPSFSSIEEKLDCFIEELREKLSVKVSNKVSDKVSDKVITEALVSIPTNSNFSNIKNGDSFDKSIDPKLSFDKDSEIDRFLDVLADKILEGKV